MAAVIAAIAAGFLAGAVALFREHRIQERQLLVAARVMDEVLATARRGINVSLATDGWAPMNFLPTHNSFLQAWETYREDLAGHLEYAEWQKLTSAIAGYEGMRATSQDEPPSSFKEPLEDIDRLMETARHELKPYRTKRFSLWRQVQRRRKRGDWAAVRSS